MQVKTLLSTTIAAAILALSSGIPTALAGSPILAQEHGDPVGGCPPPFEMHHAANYDHEHSGTHSNELFYSYQVDNQAIVVPENIDAMASIANTDRALGLVQEFVGRAATMAE